MNVFSFDLATTTTSLNHAFMYGLALGFILGFFRHAVIGVVERKTP